MGVLAQVGKIELVPGSFPPCNMLVEDIIVNSLKYAFLLLLGISIYLIIVKKIKGWYWAVIIITILLAIPSFIAFRGFATNWMGYFEWWHFSCL